MKKLWTKLFRQQGKAPKVTVVQGDCVGDWIQDVALDNSPLVQLLLAVLLILACAVLSPS